MGNFKSPPPVRAIKLVEVKYLRLSAKEGKSFLSGVQYAALVSEVQCLADWPNGPRMAHLTVESIDEFFELKEKGGIYGKINARVYFGYLAKKRWIYVLGAYKKEEEGQTPKHIVLKMRNRLRELKLQHGE